MIFDDLANALIFIDDISFEALYRHFLERFQGYPYESEIFSAMVMVPLAQKYDVKWRKMVWMEYMVAMRYVNCDECLVSSFKLQFYLHFSIISLMLYYSVLLSVVVDDLS